MDKEKVKEFPLEVMENLNPTYIKYMTFTNGDVAIVNSEDDNEINQKNNRLNPIEIQNNLENQQINGINPEFLENKENNQINNVMDANFENNEKYGNEINNMDDNNNNYNNINDEKYENQINNDFNVNEYINDDGNQKEPNEQKEIKIDTDIENEKEIEQEKKRTKVKEIMIGNRRIEQYDGAEYDNYSNSNIKIDNQNIDNQYINYNPHFIKMNYQNYNKLPPTYYNNEQNNVLNKNINVDDIDKNPGFKSNYQYEINNIELKTEINQQNQNDQSGEQITFNPKKLNNQNQNNSNNSSNVVKEKSNYTLYSSNNCKSGNSYISKNYKGSDKTTFMEDKQTNYSTSQNNNNTVKSFQINDEIKPEFSNQKLLTTNNTKVINAIPLENYIQSQMKNNSNSNNINPKIFVATDANIAYVLPEQTKEDIQLDINFKQSFNKNDNNENLNNAKTNIYNNIIQNSNNKNNQYYSSQNENQGHNINNKNNQYDRQNNLNHKTLFITTILIYIG